MTLDDLMKMWDNDCVIGDSHLTREMTNLPIVHNKYMKLLMNFRQQKLAVENSIDELIPDKTLYYRGKLDEETITRRGWKPYNLLLTGTDASMYVNADHDIMKLKTKKALLDEKIKYLEEVIRQINQRSFLIKNIIEWNKFTNGTN